MYTQPQKKFRARDEAQVFEETRLTGERMIVQRVFLAGGDAHKAVNHSPGDSPAHAGSRARIELLPAA